MRAIEMNQFLQGQIIWTRNRRDAPQIVESNTQVACPDVRPTVEHDVAYTQPARELMVDEKKKNSANTRRRALTELRPKIAL